MLNDVRITGGNLAAYRMPGNYRGGLGFKHILLQHHPVQLGDDGFRSGLHDIECAVQAVFGPFHIHRLGLSRLGAVMLFYLDGVIGQG